MSDKKKPNELQSPNQRSHSFFFFQREGLYSQGPPVLKGCVEALDVGEEHGGKASEEPGQLATWTGSPRFTHRNAPEHQAPFRSLLELSLSAALERDISWVPLSLPHLPSSSPCLLSPDFWALYEKRGKFIPDYRSIGLS